MQTLLAEEIRIGTSHRLRVILIRRHDLFDQHYVTNPAIFVFHPHYRTNKKWQRLKHFVSIATDKPFVSYFIPAVAKADSDGWHPPPPSKQWNKNHLIQRRTLEFKHASLSMRCLLAADFSNAIYQWFYFYGRGMKMSCRFLRLVWKVTSRMLIQYCENPSTVVTSQLYVLIQQCDKSTSRNHLSNIFVNSVVWKSTNRSHFTNIFVISVV